MSDKAMTLLQKGRSLNESGRWRGLAQLGIVRLQFQTGQFAGLLSDYKKVVQQVPEDVRAEVMHVVLLARGLRAAVPRSDDHAFLDRDTRAVVTIEVQQSARAPQRRI